MKATSAVTAARTGHPAYSQDMPREARSVGEARRLVGVALGAWGLDELAEDGALLASELVGNAVRHTRCRVLRLEVARTAPGVVRIAVTDRSPALPVRRDPADAETYGRGLLIVEALAARWGTEPLPWGKRVWAELVHPRAAR